MAKQEDKPQKAEPRIVAAVGASVNASKKNISRLLEAAQSQAVTDALAQGVSVNDTEELRKRMKDARQKVLDANK